MTGDGRKRSADSSSADRRTGARRQPKGIPAGGQFDANEHDEAGNRMFGIYGEGDPYIDEARALNDELDAMWVEHQRFRLANGAHTIRGGGAERTERERAIRARLTELKDRTDGRGFEPYTFSTPPPVEFETFHGLPGEEDSDHEYGSASEGVRFREVLFHRDRIPAEIEADIEQGVASGALSPLFDYEVEFKDADWLTLSTLSVKMTKKEGVSQDEYLNVLRAKTAPGRPEYSDRLRATVSRLRDRLGAYNAGSGARFEKPTDFEFKTEVTTDLPHLGD